MTSQFKHQLCPKYPEILDSLLAPADIGDGWFALVDELCALLSEDVKKTGLPCKATQVKEKLGELRCRCALPPQSDYRRAAIEAARLKSMVTCDVCGLAGQLVAESGWLRTRCQLHHNERIL